MLRAVVTALAVDHHRGGEHQPPDVAPAHGLQQHGGAGDVDVAVLRQVGQVHAQADERGLVADCVDAVQRSRDQLRVPDVADDQLGPGRPVIRHAVVDRRVQRVQSAHVMALRQGRVGDMRADEAGGASNEYPHACSEARPAGGHARAPESVTAP